MSETVTVKAPFDLMALLATMKSAKEQNIRMSIWDRDIKAVEDAINTINGIRSIAVSFNVYSGLDSAIEDELDHGPKSIVS